MNSQVIQTPIKFSIKTNNLDEIHKKIDKSFSKVNINKLGSKLPHSNDVSNMNPKIGPDNLDSNISPNISLLNGNRGIKKSINCKEKFKNDLIFKQYSKKNPEDMVSKIKKYNDCKDTVIIEPETSSKLVIHPLPMCENFSQSNEAVTILSEALNHSKTIEKSNVKAIFKTLEEKINNIDKICKFNSLSQLNYSNDQTYKIDKTIDNKDGNSQFVKISLKMQPKKVIIENGGIFADPNELDEVKNIIESQRLDKPSKFLQKLKENEISQKPKEKPSKNISSRRKFSPKNYGCDNVRKYPEDDEKRGSKKKRCDTKSNCEKNNFCDRTSRSQYKNDENRRNQSKSPMRKSSRYRNKSPETKFTFTTLGEEIKSQVLSPVTMTDATTKCVLKNQYTDFIMESTVDLSERVLEDSFHFTSLNKVRIKDKSKITENIRKLLRKNNKVEISCNPNIDCAELVAQNTAMTFSASSGIAIGINNLQSNLESHNSPTSFLSPINSNEANSFIFPNINEHQPPAIELSSPIQTISDSVSNPFVKSNSISFKISPKKMQSSNVFSSQMTEEILTSLKFHPKSESIADNSDSIFDNSSASIDLSLTEFKPTFKVPFCIEKKIKKSASERKGSNDDCLELQIEEQPSLEKFHSLQIEAKQVDLIELPSKDSTISLKMEKFDLIKNLEFGKSMDNIEVCKTVIDKPNMRKRSKSKTPEDELINHRKIPKNSSDSNEEKNKDLITKNLKIDSAVQMEWQHQLLNKLKDKGLSEMSEEIIKDKFKSYQFESLNQNKKKSKENDNVKSSISNKHTKNILSPKKDSKEPSNSRKRSKNLLNSDKLSKLDSISTNVSKVHSTRRKRSRSISTCKRGFNDNLPSRKRSNSTSIYKKPFKELSSSKRLNKNRSPSRQYFHSHSTLKTHSEYYFISRKRSRGRSDSKRSRKKLASRKRSKSHSISGEHSRYRSISGEHSRHRSISRKRSKNYSNSRSHLRNHSSSRRRSKSRSVSKNHQTNHSNARKHRKHLLVAKSRPRSSSSSKNSFERKRSKSNSFFKRCPKNYLIHDKHSRSSPSSRKHSQNMSHSRRHSKDRSGSKKRLGSNFKKRKSSSNDLTSKQSRKSKSPCKHSFDQLHCTSRSTQRECSKSNSVEKKLVNELPDLTNNSEYSSKRKFAPKSNSYQLTGLNNESVTESLNLNEIPCPLSTFRTNRISRKSQHYSSSDKKLKAQNDNSKCLEIKSESESKIICLPIAETINESQVESMEKNLLVDSVFDNKSTEIDSEFVREIIVKSSATEIQSLSSVVTSLGPCKSKTVVTLTSSNIDVQTPYPTNSTANISQPSIDPTKHEFNQCSLLELIEQNYLQTFLNQYTCNGALFEGKSSANLVQTVQTPISCNPSFTQSYNNQIGSCNMNESLPFKNENQFMPIHSTIPNNMYNSSYNHNNYSLTNVFQSTIGNISQPAFGNFWFLPSNYGSFNNQFIANETQYHPIPFQTESISANITINCHDQTFSNNNNNVNNSVDKVDQNKSEPEDKVYTSSHKTPNLDALAKIFISKKSSTSSLMNEVMDMDLASDSCKTADSHKAINDHNELSDKDDLSSCEDFEYEASSPLDPFEKFPHAPRPKYEHIIETEVHQSALGKRFEYAYLKSTVCNCVPPNPDEIKLGKTACGENCFNRRIKVECNRKCPVYELCTNRRFQEHIYTPFEPFYCSNGKGWGIRSTYKIFPGTFIIEYVGELIDFHEFLHRIRQKSVYNHHFIMAIQKDMYIDAGNKGNWSRFVNHSCDPNTVIERWVVNGKTRIGFFSKKYIDENEEITIDYQFQQYGMIEQKCFCSSANCTGVMGKVNEKLQEQIKTSHIRLRKELIQKITMRSSLKEISHVSDMITVIKEEGLDRDTFYSFLEVLLRTDSEICIRTFIECGGLKVITSYLYSVQWNDWPLKLLYLQCLDHFKLKKRIIVSSGCTAIELVEYWAENPRYVLEHCTEEIQDKEALNLETEKNEIESSEDSVPFDGSTKVKFHLIDSMLSVEPIEIQIKELALSIKQYFANEKEKFYIPKLKNTNSDLLQDISINDSESKSKDSASRASSVQGDYVKSKKRKIRRKCTEAIRRLSKDEFRRLFSERHERCLAEKNSITPTENTLGLSNLDMNSPEAFEVVKKLLSNVIIDEINRLKHSDKFLIMPMEFQNLDLDKILSDLNIVGQEDILSLIQQSSDENKNSSASTYSNSSSKSQDENLKPDLSLIAKKPIGLPPNWHSRRSESGKMYYYNIITKKTQWEEPIYPWDAGESDPMAYDFNNASLYQVTREDVQIMYEEYKRSFKQNKLEEKRRNRLERSIQRKLSLTAGEKNKIEFSKEVFRAVKAIMKPYNTSSCKVGRIQHKHDLKFLCEKLSDTVITKEVKLVANLEDLEMNANVRSKIKTYIEKYMSSQGRCFKRSLKHKSRSKQFNIDKQSVDDCMTSVTSHATDSFKKPPSQVSNSPDFSP